VPWHAVQSQPHPFGMVHTYEQQGQRAPGATLPHTLNVVLMTATSMA